MRPVHVIIIIIIMLIIIIVIQVLNIIIVMSIVICVFILLLLTILRLLRPMLKQISCQILVRVEEDLNRRGCVFLVRRPFSHGSKSS